ncbi:MAG: hypothetical protein IJ268_05390 [Proteobacteria bacterium]|nr:hypothetical protein [Pseudomonadota bacterium]
MKTIAKRALYSAVLITAFIMPATSFAQSWEPENAWKVNQDEWNVPSKTSNPPPSKQTPTYNSSNYPSNITPPNSQIPPAIPPSIEVEDIKTSERCKPITIKAKILDHTSINQVFIYYASGNLNYTMLPMKSSPQAPNIFIATLPETATQGDYIDYYIEGYNAQKKLIANSGNALTPSRIFFTGKCLFNMPETSPSNSPQIKNNLSPYVVSQIFQFSIMLGTAAGLVNDRTLNCDGDSRCESNSALSSRITPGIASLPLHLRASAMFNLPKHFQLGIYVRGQLYNIVKSSLSNKAKAEVKFPEQYNIMVGLDIRYLALWEQPYRLYVGLEFGWGGANATVDMGPRYNNFKDIYIYKGPVHIAPEIGFLWTIDKNVGFAFELTIPVVFPERPSIFFDFSIGPYFQF